MSPIDVEILLQAEAVRAWHVDAVDALPVDEVRVTLVTDGSTWGRDVDSLLRRERRLGDLSARGSDLLPPGSSPGRHAAEDAVVTQEVRSGTRIDLSGGPVRPGCWTLTFDDRPGEDAAVQALLANRFPVVRVVDEHGRVIVEGRPGSEVPGLLAAALDDVLAGCVQLLVAAVAGHPLRLPAEPGGHDAPGTGGVPTPKARARRAWAAAVARRVYRRLYRSPHWRVGWRFTEGPGALAAGGLAGERWRDLPDDGRHFYADPFPIEVDGRTYLFVEDYDHRLGRGVISVLEFDGQGPVGTPRPVLEHDVHLSYPVVLEDDGQLWMIPETSAAGTVELYRATEFPDRWELHSVLLSDLDANDTTPFRHEGRWWLSATVRHGGSCSDALHLWYADRLAGPWVAHAGNPVLVDIASARPAGRPERHGGRLLRPVQDGRRGYGAALAVAEVVTLDPATFAQRVVARIPPDPSWPGSRLHTLNRAGRLEVVDGSARSSRLRHRSRR